MIHEYEIDGIPVRTGDIICTTNGTEGTPIGRLWKMTREFIPGDVDHVAMYTGPGGWCVESGATGGVAMFEIPNGKWDAEAMYGQRKGMDTLYGIAYPYLPKLSADKIREEAAAFCMDQIGKPYNLNFLDSDNIFRYYCSQLIWAGFNRLGIDLNTGVGVPHIPGSESIIFPQELWNACYHVRAGV